jgi:tRNA(Arg) A34 adenosine deaminase TadA
MDARTDGHDAPQSAIDVMMMERCVRLSANATQSGELPFASLICRGNELVVETTNRVARDGDVTRHAGILPIARFTPQSSLARCARTPFGKRELRVSSIPSSRP